MTTDEQSFALRADQTLLHVADTVDAALGDDLDVDFEGAILSITLPKGGQYVINKHAPNREIWLSSPTSGAWHFAWDGETWRSTRGAETLFLLLAGELERACGKPVAL